MANSDFIGRAKNIIIKELIKDQGIILGINSAKVTSPEKLKGTHIFDYHQNPNTINTVKTFITVQVHISDPIIQNELFIRPTVEIWVISHENHMTVDNIPKVNVNRNDYLSSLLDDKLNGYTGLGYGKLKLVSNLEGAYQQNYLYRQMIFETVDLNDSVCDLE